MKNWKCLGALSLRILGTSFLLSQSAEAAIDPEIEKAAQQGDDEGQCSLALMYYNSRDVEQNYKLAMQWFEKAATQHNDLGAQTYIGEMYYNGKGVEQNYKLPMHWFEKAAEKDFIKAQLNLGIMYAEGKGVRQNIQTAKEYFGKACDNGLQRACNNYAKLNHSFIILDPGKGGEPLKNMFGKLEIMNLSGGVMLPS